MIEAPSQPKLKPDMSTAQLIQRLTQQTTTLVRQELQLAQLELSLKAKRAGSGVGALGAAGILGLLALQVLLAAAVLGLATAVPGWLAALIVAGVLLLLAAILGLFGRGQLSKALPAAPSQAIESSKQDVTAITKAARR